MPCCSPPPPPSRSRAAAPRRSPPHRQKQSPTAAEQSPAVATAALTITDPWVKTAKKGMSAAFGTLVNNTDAEVTSSPAPRRCRRRSSCTRSWRPTERWSCGPRRAASSSPRAARTSSARRRPHHADGPRRGGAAGRPDPLHAPLKGGKTLEFTAVGKDFAGGKEDYQPGMGTGRSHSDRTAAGARSRAALRAAASAPSDRRPLCPSTPRRRDARRRRRGALPRRPTRPGSRRLRRPTPCSSASTCAPDTGREAVVRIIQLLTDDARRLTQGRPALADTEPELAATPARLTITFGFGPGLFTAAEGGGAASDALPRSRSTSWTSGGAAATCWCRSAPTTRSPSPTRCG